MEKFIKILFKIINYLIKKKPSYIFMKLKNHEVVIDALLYLHIMITIKIYVSCIYFFGIYLAPTNGTEQQSQHSTPC